MLREWRAALAASQILGFVLVLVIIVGVTVAFGHPADDADAQWFMSLMRPDTGTTCCSGPSNPNPDCLAVKSRQTAEGYEVLIDERFPGRIRAGWEKVPPQKILVHSPNPTGAAVACWLPSMGILCFVRPPDT